jgi:hypothetical protein
MGIVLQIFLTEIYCGGQSGPKKQRPFWFTLNLAVKFQQKQEKSENWNRGEVLRALTLKSNCGYF